MPMVYFLFIALVFKDVVADEPSCGSRFQYEYDFLQKLLRFEEKLNQQDNFIKYLISRQADTDTKVGVLQSRPNIVSSYIRWGKATCPSGSELIYNGFASGSKGTQAGSGSNILCLPNDPTWDQYSDGFGEGTRTWGLQYKLEGNLFRELNGLSVLCSVCQVNRAGILMLPGKNKCPQGYVKEYNGYIFSGLYDKASSANFVCFDGSPDGGHTVTGLAGASLGIVQTECGAIKCPPYVEGRELACVVCSFSAGAENN